MRRCKHACKQVKKEVLTPQPLFLPEAGSAYSAFTSNIQSCILFQRIEKKYKKWEELLCSP